MTKFDIILLKYFKLCTMISTLRTELTFSQRAKFVAITMANM